MKKFTFSICTILIIAFCETAAQTYTFSLYFEDAIGNKDTIILGYDSSATFNIDTAFNEINIINQAINPAFDIRNTNETYYPDYWAPVHHTYHTKRNILTIADTSIFTSALEFEIHSQIAEINIHCNNYPIKISWDSSYFTGPFMENIILTNWDDPFGWFDASTGCGWSPDIIVYLKNVSEQYLQTANMCDFSFTDTSGINYNLEKFYVGFNPKEYYSGISEIVEPIVPVYPNPFNEELAISSLQFAKEKNEIILYNVFGEEILSQTCTTANCKLPTANFPPGVYFLKVNDQVKKVIKL